jgi:hypothetical protein
MHYCPAVTTIQASGKFKSESFKERKNEKISDAYNGSWIDRPRREWGGIFFQ